MSRVSSCPMVTVTRFIGCHSSVDLEFLLPATKDNDYFRIISVLELLKCSHWKQMKMRKYDVI